MKYDFSHLVQPPEGQEVCDFCSSPSIFKSYDCEDFVACALQAQMKPSSGGGKITFVNPSIGAWAACRECAALIDSDNWDALSERSLRTILAGKPYLVLFRDGLLRALRTMHANFRRLRKLSN